MGVRKNQASLSIQEKQKFVNALLMLKSNGTYDRYVQMHVDAMNHATPSGGNPMMRNAAHRGPAFLPWHREYLRRFELELQNVDPTVTLPYWDWTVDNSSSSSIWSQDFMGGDGDANNNNIVANGPFAYNTGNWTLSIDGPALRRTLGRNSNPLPTTSEVNDCLAVTPYDSSPWDASSNENTSFRNRLEGWRGQGQIHNRVHQWVGGSMVFGSSPNDPVFFLHHCNVDRLWARWQFMHPSEGYLPVGGTNTGHNSDDPMFPWTDTPRGVIDHRSLGYEYDTDPPLTNTPPDPPNGLTVTASSSDQINLAWNPPSNNGGSPLREYRIERAQGTGSGWTTVATVLASENSYSNRFLASNTSYSYRVYASNIAGESNPSNISSARTLSAGSRTICFIATAAYGSELEPPVQFLREFRDNVVLKSRFQKPFENMLDVYYKFSPPIANLMSRNKPFKYTMKYTVVWPFVALTRAAAFLVEPFVDDDKDQRH